MKRKRLCFLLLLFLLVDLVMLIDELVSERWSMDMDSFDNILE